MWGRLLTKLLTCAPIANRQPRRINNPPQDTIPMPLSCPESAQLAQFVGRSPWTAADALVGSLGFDEAYFATEERVQGDPRRPGGLPHRCIRIPNFRKTKWHWDDILPHWPYGRLSYSSLDSFLIGSNFWTFRASFRASTLALSSVNDWPAASTFCSKTTARSI